MKSSWKTIRVVVEITVNSNKSKRELTRELATAMDSLGWEEVTWFQHQHETGVMEYKDFDRVVAARRK